MFITLSNLSTTISHQYYNMVKYLVISLIFMLSTAYAQQPPQYEVRKIVPLKLETVNLGQRIICYRPTRHGIPNMSVTKSGDKVIVHNYGHSGSGWTLAPGAITYVNGLLQKSEYADDLKPDTPITIIGAGVIGLFTAYDLIDKGYSNITIIAEKFDGLASNNAGGLLKPSFMDDSSDVKSLMDKIMVWTYPIYRMRSVC